MEGEEERGGKREGEKGEKEKRKDLKNKKIRKRKFINKELEEKGCMKLRSIMTIKNHINLYILNLRKFHAQII